MRLKQEVTITRGRHDQRIIILVPEIKDKETVDPLCMSNLKKI